MKNLALMYVRRFVLQILFQLSPQRAHFYVRYAVLERNIQIDGTLFVLHNAGLFSCFMTTMWGVIEATYHGHAVQQIDSRLGIQAFTNSSNQSIWNILFNAPPKSAKSKLDPLPININPFYHHGTYVDIVQRHLGIDWMRWYFTTYMSPSERVLERSRFFADKYSIRHGDSAAVLIRGTDKHTEVTPVGLSAYFAIVDHLFAAGDIQKIIIQTDQRQYRDAFIAQYGVRCEYLSELPVTKGSIVMHDTVGIISDRESFAVDLYAMCLALSESKVVITCTSNVGFFLSAHALIRGSRVIQLP
ncbi:hypothetical protein [Cyanobium sp. CH-040]|uniref:hypothetical protein n=1 Tax=Cyanobium sp. CH-040 TaxID=2823708 RepID=UPI0020CDBB59|nr:hypothetical protein [Cyanobium sp. CH-040]MCP9927909.1 hypothetical protein [Cyanobium sp. CH-040]